MLNPCQWGRRGRAFCRLMLVLAWEKLASALVIAMERCEQGLYLDNSLPGSVRGTKSIYDGSHTHLAHPDLSAGSGTCMDVLLPYHPKVRRPAEM